MTDSGVMMNGPEAVRVGTINGYVKLCASEPISNCQPSTSTNNISLNGSEIVAGETIIIPIDISTLATTMSMIRNGMKMVKPIWKPVFSSLVTKAGTSSGRGTSSGPCIGGACEMRANSARSVS